MDKSQIFYPSVLSLLNKGIVVVQTDGIHFYDSNKVEEESKQIKFERPITTDKENEKISMSQFPEKEGGFILILVKEKLYLIQSSGYILKEENLPEMTSLENIKIIPYKEEENNLLYIISYKTNSKQFGFNYYKFDLINKKNLLLKIKILDNLKNPLKINNSNADIFGSSCLFMKNLENENVFSCFLGVGFPAEIQARMFSIKNDEFEEKNSYKYLIGHYEIENFNLISAIPNEQKDSAIIYFYKNKILTKIDFDFVKGLSSPSAVTIDVNLPDEYWKLESEIMKESKESIFSSRLYWTNCKSYLIFLNSNFSLVNKGFISHDNKCANLLSYSNFFKENQYSLNVDSLNNNKILVRQKRSLAGSAVTVPEKCKQDSTDGYSDESISFNLCLLCDNDKGYYRVYDPNKTIYDNGKGFVQCFNESTKKNFYLDKSESGSDKTKWVYKPCYETCETCNTTGDAYDHKCETCALRYKFFTDSESGKKLCEAECSYAYYYTIPLEYYECTETNSCPDEAPYLVPAIKKCVPNCLNEEGYTFRYAGNCYASCEAAKAEDDNSIGAEVNTCRDKTGVDAPRCVATYSSINSDDFITSEGIRTKAQTYAKEFANTLTHIDYYNNSDAILIIYKDPTCITELGLKVPKIDLDDSCEEKIKNDLKSKHADFDESTDLIIALVGGESTSKNIKSSFSYFYKDGTYVNISQICSDATVQVTKQVDLEQVDDEAELIAAQGVDIFDADSPFYTDICFMYDSPNGKDATPNDRLNTYFPNISLCETGCTPDGVNLTTFEVNCKCEFSDIMSSTGVGEKLLEDSFGEVFEMIDNSNIVIFKCGKDVFVAKHFFKNVGSYIVLGIMVAEIACIVVYYLVSYNPMLRYLYYLSEYQCSAIEMKNNNKGDKDKDKNKNKDNILTAKLQKAKAPPKKDENPGMKTPAADKLIDEDPKKPKKLDINEPNVINSENKLLQKKEEKNEKDNLKKGNKNEKKPMYSDKLKEDYDIEMDEYLKTDVDDMEFEDALKYDKRGFCEYFCENFKNEQIIMDTFFNQESLKPMTIKIIIFFLNVILYFVINGLFYSEEYVSDLFNSDEEEHFFSFFPRSITRFIYTTIVGEIIGVIVDFVAFDENKVKRLFKREKKNTLQIRYEISVMTKDIKRNYLILMIICGVIDLISLYYVNCFNNVYPNLTGEWIKSSICIIIIIQVLSILRILAETAIRAIAFKCKSERIYKIKDLLD